MRKKFSSNPESLISGGYQDFITYINELSANIMSKDIKYKSAIGNLKNTLNIIDE